MIPIIKLCQNQLSEKIILAAPVANPSYNWRLDHADEVVFIQKPVSFISVKQFYTDYPTLVDEEVNAFLKRRHCGSY